MHLNPGCPGSSNDQNLCLLGHSLLSNQECGGGHPANGAHQIDPLQPVEQSLF